MNNYKDYEYWDTIENIGDLYIEIVLVYGNEPVLFVCVNENKQRYLFMTYNSYESKYVFIKSDKEALLDMLLNKCSIEQTFRNAGKIYYSHEDLEGNIVYDIYNSLEFDAEKLPETGMMFELDFPFIREYIKKLEEETKQKQKKYQFYYNQFCNYCLKNEFDVWYEAGFTCNLRQRRDTGWALAQTSNHKSELSFSWESTNQNQINICKSACMGV